MSERGIYIVAYDVCDSKRLRRTYKTMRGYGDAMQYSIFWCELCPTERELLIGDLTEIIHHDEDRIMIVDLGPVRGHRARRVRFLGRAPKPSDEGPVVF